MLRFEIIPHNASFKEINKEILLGYITPPLKFLDLFTLTRVEKHLNYIIKLDATKHQIIIDYEDNTKLSLVGTYSEILEKLQTAYKGIKALKEKNDEYHQHISLLKCKLKRYEFCSDYICVDFNKFREATKNCCLEVSSVVIGSAMCLTVFSTGVFGTLPLSSAFCLKPCAIAIATGIGTGGVNCASMKACMNLSSSCHSLFNQQSEQVTNQISQLNNRIETHIPKAMRMKK